MARRDDRGSFEFGTTDAASRRRRNWWWLLIPLLIAAGGGYVYMFERDSAVEALRGTPLAIEPNVTRAYKWRDRQGGWQLSDQKLLKVAVQLCLVWSLIILLSL